MSNDSINPAAVAAVLETTIRSKPSETKITGRLESLDDDFGHCGLDDNVIYNEAYDKAFEKLESLKTANGRKLPSMASKKDLKYTKSSSNNMAASTENKQIQLQFDRETSNNCNRNNEYETAIAKQVNGRIDFKNNRVFSCSFCGELIDFLQTVEENFKNLVDHLVSLHDAISVIITVASLYNDEIENVTRVKKFSVPNKELTNTTDVHKFYENIAKLFIIKIKKFQCALNGWSLDDILYMEIMIVKKLNENVETNPENCNMVCADTDIIREINYFLLLQYKCKLCKVYPTKHHLRSNEHKLTKHYFRDDKIQIFGINRNDRILSSRIISSDVSSIDGYFRSIEPNVLELIERIIQFQKTKSVNVSLKLFAMYNDTSLKNVLATKLGTVKMFIIKNEILTESSKIAWIQNISSQFKLQNEKYVKPTFGKPNYYFSSMMYLEIDFFEI